MLDEWVERKVDQLCEFVPAYAKPRAILLANSGQHPTPEQCLQTCQAFRRGNGHGLAMIYQKLQLIFRDDFSMDFQPGDKEGAVVRIQIPYREEQFDDSCNNL